MKKNSGVCNQHGFVLITAMIFLILLSVIGILATDTTTLELKIAANERIIQMDFYDQEMSLAVAKIQFRDWMTTNYLTANESSAHFPPAGNDNNNNGINDLSEVSNAQGELIGIYRVRNNYDPGVNALYDIPWEDADTFGAANLHPANNIPILPHRDKPIPGSGYDPKNFEIRRFVITAYSPKDDRKVILQEGVYKAFNKYN